MGTGFTDELRLKILLSTIEVFNTHGMRFTMDDIASHMKISKKTIYTVYRSKEEMMLDMVDYLFDNVAVSIRAILEDRQMSLRDKIKAYLIAMPDEYSNIKFAELFVLRDRFPHIYEKVRMRFDSGWDPAIALLEQGKEEGIIRKDANLVIFKTMMDSSLASFFASDILKRSGLTYREGLDLVAEILLDGVRA